MTATHRMKYWEIIADNLSKAGWSWAAPQRWIRTLLADSSAIEKIIKILLELVKKVRGGVGHRL